MKRVLLKVAYDGTNYHGWQVQDVNNQITVEGVLNKTISELTGDETIKVIGGSRTDAGVHALSNMAVFDTSSQIPGDKFKYALNQRLPEDIRVIESFDVEEDFHPRHCDSIKTYEYRIYNAKIELPTKRLYSYFTYIPLDVNKMKSAAKFIEGEHDFKSFCSAGASVESTVRTVYSCEVFSSEDSGAKDIGSVVPKDITIRISGNGFLYNMVRIIAGTLMEVGRGNIEPERVLEIVASCDRTKAGPTAPPQGLCLVDYKFV